MVDGENEEIEAGIKRQLKVKHEVTGSISLGFWVRRPSRSK
jgi:hypothetical protein